MAKRWRPRTYPLMVLGVAVIDAIARLWLAAVSLMAIGLDYWLRRRLAKWAAARAGRR